MLQAGIGRVVARIRLLVDRHLEDLERAYAADIHIRIADEKYPPEGIKVVTEEFNADGVVYEKDGVRVAAFEVNHGDEIKPAYGYRIDYKGHSVVISGDTRFNENVIKHGTGVDVLVHEVAAVRPELLKDEQVKRVMEHHTSPQEAGTVFSRARPKLAVYTHVLLLERPKIPAVTVEELVGPAAVSRPPLACREDAVVQHILDQTHRRSGSICSTPN